MKIKTEIINDIETFDNMFHSFLYSNITVNQLVIQNVNIYLNKKKQGFLLNENNFFGYVKKGEKKLILFLNAYPYKLQIIPFTPLTKEELTEAINSLLEYVKVSNKVVLGINADEDVSSIFIDSVAEVLKKKAYIKIKMSIMKIGKIALEKYKAGYLRKAENTDKMLIAESLSCFEKDCYGTSVPKEKFFSLAENKIAEGNTYLFLNQENEVTSMASLSRKINDEIAIAFVYTIPKYRNQGYASSMVAKIVDKCFKSGFRYCSLFVDQNNPYSNKAYLKVGFEYVATNYEVVID